MLTPPDISAKTIIAHIADDYGLRIRQATFLPIGADAYAAVYRLDADDGTPYFLKLRRGSFDDVIVAVPAFLHTHGVSAVMAPLPTRSGRLWTSGHGFTWILYPFFDGRNGFAAPLSDTQWLTLGRTMRAVHSVVLPPTLANRVPREDYAPRWRDIVTQYTQQAERDVYDDPIARRLAAWWRSHRDEIDTVVDRSAQLAAALRERERPFVLCHSDLHAGNVLVARSGDLTIVDWDEPIYAPKERDLMFMGGGVGEVWNTAHEENAYYAGYGPAEIDLVVLAYYRYERIVADFAAYGLQIFGLHGSAEDREDGRDKLSTVFLPGSVLEIAHRTYQRLPASLSS